MSSHEVPLPVRAAYKGIFRIFIEATSRGVYIEGKENLPENPPYFIAFNHPGWVEGLIPYILLPLKDWPYTLTKIETMENGSLWGKVMHSIGFIGIHRGEADTKAIRKVLEHLQNGHIIATSPEGTRGRGDERLKIKDAKAGLIYLSQKFDPPIPIVPMAVWGQNEWTAPLIDEEGIHKADFLNLRKEPLYVKIGEPFIPEMREGNRSESRNELADQLLERIRGLLPPDRRERSTAV